MKKNCDSEDACSNEKMIASDHDDANVTDSDWSIKYCWWDAKWFDENISCVMSESWGLHCIIDQIIINMINSVFSVFILCQQMDTTDH